VQRYEGRELCLRRAADPRLLYELIPNRCGANAHGFMDAERTLEKPPGTYRIVLIGDSVAQGQGVPRDARFGTLLEAELNARDPTSHYEVVHLALTGYSTRQQLIVLEALGLAHQPDLLLWSYVLNDPAHPVFHDANGEAGRYFFAPDWHLPQFLRKSWFQARENVVRWARGCDRDFHATLHCVYRDQVVTNLGALAALTNAAHVPTVLLIHPLLGDESFASYRARWIHADIAQIARTLGLDVIDLLDAVQDHRPADLAQKTADRVDPWHPNALGHRLFADYLVERLLPRLPERPQL
jgi:lysophospholipase L1-like esterase